MTHEQMTRDPFAAIDGARFDALEEKAIDLASKLAWGSRLEGIEYAPSDIVHAMTGEGVTFGPGWDRSFEPFTGSWVGGDLHDAAHGYHHVWAKAQKEGDRVVQAVTMTPACGGEPTQAWNLCERVGGLLRIRGRVADHALIGFRLASAGLVWFGEQAGDQLAVHVERVWAREQLYDIRGMVIRVEADAVVEVAPSDWRYHRVDDTAVDA